MERCKRGSGQIPDRTPIFLQCMLEIHISLQRFYSSFVSNANFALVHSNWQVNLCWIFRISNGGPLKSAALFSRIPRKAGPWLHVRQTSRAADCALLAVRKWLPYGTDTSCRYYCRRTSLDAMRVSGPGARGPGVRVTTWITTLEYIGAACNEYYWRLRRGRRGRRSDHQARAKRDHETRCTQGARKVLLRLRARDTHCARSVFSHLFNEAEPFAAILIAHGTHVFFLGGGTPEAASAHPHQLEGLGERGSVQSPDCKYILDPLRA